MGWAGHEQEKTIIKFKDATVRSRSLQVCVCEKESMRERECVCVCELSLSLSLPPSLSPVSLDMKRTSVMTPAYVSTLGSVWCWPSHCAGACAFRGLTTTWSGLLTVMRASGFPSLFYRQAAEGSKHTAAAKQASDFSKGRFACESECIIVAGKWEVGVRVRDDECRLLTKSLSFALLHET